MNSNIYQDEFIQFKLINLVVKAKPLILFFYSTTNIHKLQKTPAMKSGFKNEFENRFISKFCSKTITKFFLIKIIF